MTQTTYKDFPTAVHYSSLMQVKPGSLAGVGSLVLFSYRYRVRPVISRLYSGEVYCRPQLSLQVTPVGSYPEPEGVMGNWDGVGRSQPANYPAADLKEQL